MYQQWKTHVPPSDQPWEKCQRFPVMKRTKNTFWWWRKWKLSNADWVKYGNDTKWHPGNKASSPPGLWSLNLDSRLRTRCFVPGGHTVSLCLHAPSNFLERKKKCSQPWLMPDYSIRWLPATWIPNYYNFLFFATHGRSLRTGSMFHAFGTQQPCPYL